MTPIRQDDAAGLAGDPYTWDASKAVAEAYAAGQPVTLPCTTRLRARLE